MTEKFTAGMQYLGMIVASASDEIRLDSLEMLLAGAFAGFKTRGIHASLESKFASNISIEVYVDVAGKNGRFRPPLVTREIAEAYDYLIQTLREMGYTEMEIIRDPSRIGLEEPNENPLFEVVDVNHH